MASWDWIGGAGSWNDAGSWTDVVEGGFGVPAAGDFAFINSGAVTNNAAAVAFEIRILGSASLTTSGSLAVGNEILIGFGGSGTATMAITGGTVTTPLISVGIGPAGLLTVSGGSTVAAAIAVSQGSVIVGGTSPASAGTINGSIALGSVGSSLTFRTTNDASYGGNVSGAGSILIDSAGRTTTLTGDNSGHSGLTTINAGSTLQIGDGVGIAGRLGSGAIINNGSLAFAYGNEMITTITVSNNISGVGGLRFSGFVDAFLTGTNSYSGSTLIENNAVVYVGNGGTTGTLGTGAVANNGGVVFDHAAGNYYHNNVISGSGFLDVQGAGAEYLTANNSYSGLTYVESGVLVVGAGGASGTLGTGNVILYNGAQLDLFRSDTQLIANNIIGSFDGDGTVRVFLNRTAILTGTNSYGATYIASGSTLQIGNGNQTGTLGTGAVTVDGALTFNHSFGNYFHTNAIGGSGGLTVNGSGAEILSGVNTYTGVTTVNSTTLALSGAGSISASSSLTLNGTGRFNIGNISGASTSVRDVNMTGTGTEIALFGKTLIVTEANSFAGPGAFTGSGGADSVIFNVATANFTLAGGQGAVFNSWTDGVDSIVINGGAIANILTGDELRATTINGGAGNDRIIIGNGAGNYNGGADSDTLVVGSNMTLTGTISQFEALEISGGAGFTLGAAQFASGFASNAALSGSGVITVNMSLGNQTVAARAMTGGAALSLLVNGSSGVDIVKGALGATNNLQGNDGTDNLVGGSLADTINGGNDIDKIRGDGGADILTGGAAADVFKFRNAADSGTGAAADTITDFLSGTDRLNFARIDANSGLGGDQAFAFVGTGAFTGGGAGSIRYVDTGNDIRVEADVDGNGVADMHILLQGAGVVGTLTAADFVL